MDEGTPAGACCTPLGAAGLSDVEAEEVARMFKALGDPHRVRLINRLAAADEPVCVCDLTPVVGLAQPTVSHHLKRLLDAGLIVRERRGTWSHYSLAPGAVERLAAVADLRKAPA